MDSKVEKLIEKSRGVAQNNINKAILSDIEIALPPFEKQKEIAHILSQADKARLQRKAANALTDQFLQSTFLSMFGDPVRNEKGWETVKLEDLVASFKYGTNQKASEFDAKETPVLRIPNVVGNQIDFSDLKYAQLPQREYEDLKLSLGDLLFVRTNGNPNYIGRCAVFKDDFDCVYASYLIRARLRQRNIATSIYLQTVLSYDTFRPLVLRKAKTTAGNYNINTEALKQFVVPLPPLHLQQQFADIVAQTEQLRQRQRAHEAELEGLFQGLLAKYFG